MNCLKPTLLAQYIPRLHYVLIFIFIILNLYPHPIHSNHCNFGIFYLTTLSFTGMYVLLILIVISKDTQNLTFHPWVPSVWGFIFYVFFLASWSSSENGNFISATWNTAMPINCTLSNTKLHCVERHNKPLMCSKLGKSVGDTVAEQEATFSACCKLLDRQHHSGLF